MRVLISSSGSSLWVPLPEGCIDTDSKDCPERRGGLFNYNDSSTWRADNLYELPLQAESSLGYSGNALVGFDNVTLGWMGSGGPPLNNTVVAGFATKDFFVGQLGLNARPVNISDFNDQHSSPLTALFEDDKIPSLTWSYTAGAPYRQNKAYGSLTMGGYDLIRSDQNHNVTFKMGVDTSRDLLVAITNVSTNGSSLLDTGLYAFIDSTVPHIWLPLAVCAQFEQVFGLVYDNTTDLYLVNDTLHEQLLTSGANVIISLAASLAASADSTVSTLDITLPYGAFDMVVGYPLASSREINATSRYFPLRRASSSSEYTLGRTFLQEAYLHVDYGRSTFTVSQTQFPSDPADPGTIIAVYPDVPGQNGSNEAKQPNDSSPSNKRTRNGMIAGITIGIVLSTASIVAAALFHRRFRRQRGLKAATQRNFLSAPGIPGYVAEGDKAELAGIAIHEDRRRFRSRIFLDGREIPLTRSHGRQEVSLTATTPASELESGSKTPASELGGVKCALKSELDAVNREIFELPAEVAKELP